MTVKVNNVSENAKRYVVARLVDTVLWYWGSWDNEDDARAVAREIDGLVVIND